MSGPEGPTGAPGPTRGWSRWLAAPIALSASVTETVVEVVIGPDAAGRGLLLMTTTAETASSSATLARCAISVNGVSLASGRPLQPIDLRPASVFTVQDATMAAGDVAAVRCTSVGDGVSITEARLTWLKVGS